MAAGALLVATSIIYSEGSFFTFFYTYSAIVYKGRFLNEYIF